MTTDILLQERPVVSPAQPDALWWSAPSAPPVARPRASYRLRRRFLVLWSWEAMHPTLGRAKGFEFSKRTAKWSARSWIRSARPTEPQAPVQEVRRG